MFNPQSDQTSALKQQTSLVSLYDCQGPVSALWRRGIRSTDSRAVIAYFIVSISRRGSVLSFDFAELPRCLERAESCGRKRIDELL